MDALLARLQIRHLRLVHAVAETGQLSLAADRLALTQPAASRSLAEVERIVGVPLFHRHAKGMLPTAIGEIVIRHAGTLLGQLDSAAHEIAAFRGGLAGVVRVGAVTGPAVRFVVPAIQHLKAEAQRAEVSVEVKPSVELMAGLLRGDLDIALCRVPNDVESRDLDIMRGRVEEIRLLTRAGHPLHDAAPVPLSRLGGLTWVIQQSGHPIRDTIEQAFLNRSLPAPQNTVDTASLLVSLSYLKNTDAVAAMTVEVAELLTARAESGWAVLAMKEALILSPYHLIRHRHRAMSPICARLLDLLASEIQTRPASAG